MTAVFVTGASGYVGRRLLRVLAERDTVPVVALTRDADRLAALVPPMPGWRYVRGDLNDAPTVAQALPPGAIVLHLAAVTGKAPRQEFQRVNVGGTATLVDAARKTGATRFVFVSSIAAGFADQRHYPYAQTKLAAERIVLASGLDALIVRPTMIFGLKSPVLRGLAALAGAPIGVRPGSALQLVQPIDRDDVVSALLDWLEQPGVAEIVELGGPDVVPMADLLIRIRRRVKGRDGPWVRLPLGVIRTALAAIEPLALPLLPLTAGQLASFANASTASPHRLTEHLSGLRGLDAMLEDVDG